MEIYRVQSSNRCPGAEGLLTGRLGPRGLGYARVSIAVAEDRWPGHPVAGGPLNGHVDNPIPVAIHHPDDKEVGELRTHRSRLYRIVARDLQQICRGIGGSQDAVTEYSAVRQPQLQILVPCAGTQSPRAGLHDAVDVTQRGKRCRGPTCGCGEREVGVSHRPAGTILKGPGDYRTRNGCTDDRGCWMAGR